jgi:hypothetical protein
VPRLLSPALLFFFLVPVAAVAAGACSDKTTNPPTLGTMGTTPPPGGGGPHPDGATAPVDAAAIDASCTALANPAPQVTQTFVAEALPLPMGGALASGTYFLTQANVFTGVSGNAGPTGFVFQETLTFVTANGVFTDAVLEGMPDGGAPASVGASGTFAVSGTTLTESATCPTTTTLQFPFTFAGSTLRTYAGQSEFVYTLQ